MAPELLKFEEFDEKVDVYAFGIILWELLTRETPFTNIDSFAILVDVVCTVRGSGFFTYHYRNLLSQNLQTDAEYFGSSKFIFQIFWALFLLTLS
jgi:serine/threonine protein kinase